MKILLINQFFHPDESPTSVLLTDVARVAAERGHTVTVICGRGTYLESESGPPPDVRVIRLPGLTFRRGTSYGKLLSYGCFFAGALLRGLALGPQDVFVCLTTPPMLACVGMAVKALRGSRLVIWEMDLYPEVAVDLKALAPDSAATRVLAAIQRFVRSRADIILALGECMRERLIASGVPPGLIRVAHNWADANLLAHTRTRVSGTVTILYSGNLGIAHDIDTIFNAMLALGGNRRFRFVFAGGGAGHRPLAARCADAGLGNAEFRAYCPRQELAHWLASADVGLVTQRAEALGSVVPSKTYSLMAAGRPILYIGPKGATPDRLIEEHGCGWSFRPGDADAVAALLRTLAEDRAALRAAGRRARQAFERHYERRRGTARVLDAVVSAGANPPLPSAVPNPRPGGLVQRPDF